MKLYELLDVIDPDRCSDIERIQIVDPNGDSWDSCDEVSIGSPLLWPLNNLDVKCIEAIDKNVIRVDVDWRSKAEEWLSCYSDDTEPDGQCGPDKPDNSEKKAALQNAIDIIESYEINRCGYCHTGGEEVETAFKMAADALKEKCEKL